MQVFGKVSILALTLLVASPSVAPASATSLPTAKRVQNVTLALGSFLEVHDADVSLDGGQTYKDPPIGSAAAQALFDVGCAAGEGLLVTLEVTHRSRGKKREFLDVGNTRNLGMQEIKREPFRAGDYVNEKGFAAGYGIYSGICFHAVKFKKVPKNGILYSFTLEQGGQEKTYKFSRREMRQEKWNPLLIVPTRACYPTLAGTCWESPDTPYKP